jgi:hypothetical protein
MANLASIKAAVAQEDEGVTVTIYQKDGDPYLGADGEPSTITVVGSESARYKRAKHAQYRRMTKRVRSGRGEATPEELEQDAVDLVAAAVIGFSGWEDGTTPLPFTPENVKMLLGFDHIMEQVQAGIHRHASFFEGS